MVAGVCAGLARRFEISVTVIRLAFAMAKELRGHGVTALAVTPGFLRSEQMLDHFESQWQSAWDARLDSLGLSRDELVTLASIIEGEVRDPRDRYYVSSVYHNRLRRGMRLEADPTVIYALGRRRRLFIRDYQTPSRYNTYLIDGLPPHPIGQPSAASLEAALYPASSDFLFFVAGPEGKHIFSRTYNEHLAAVRQVREGRGPSGS